MSANVNPKINQAADIAARIAAAQADGSLRLEIGNKGNGHLERPGNGPWNPAFVQGGTPEPEVPQGQQEPNGAPVWLGDIMGKFGATPEKSAELAQKRETALLKKQAENEKAKGMDVEPKTSQESMLTNVDPVTGEITQPQTQSAGTAEQVAEEPKPVAEAEKPNNEPKETA